MATEKRLIDANAFIEHFERAKKIAKGLFPAEMEDTLFHLYDDVIEEINKQPTVDAVKVVLCKDCKHRGDDVHCPMCFEETIEIDEGDGYWDTDYITHDRSIDDGYCDRGEREDNA